VNHFNKDWESAIRFEGAELGVFEMFRQSDRAVFVFRINGYSPQSLGEELSFVEVDPGMPRLLRVLTPSALPGHNGDVIQVAINGIFSDWIIQLYEDKAWLNPRGGHSLDAGINYIFKKTSDGSLIFDKER